MSVLMLMLYVIIGKINANVNANAINNALLTLMLLLIPGTHHKSNVNLLLSMLSVNGKCLVKYQVNYGVDFINLGNYLLRGPPYGAVGFWFCFSCCPNSGGGIRGFWLRGMSLALWRRDQSTSLAATPIFCIDAFLAYVWHTKHTKKEYKKSISLFSNQVLYITLHYPLVQYLNQNVGTNALSSCEGEVQRGCGCEEPDVRVLGGGGLHAGGDGLAGLVTPVDDARPVVGRLEAEGQIALGVEIKWHLSAG